MAALGEFEQLVLFAVLRLEDDAYGVRIAEEIESRTGRTVSAGAVYTTLSRLEGRSFVTSKVGETAPSRGGRRRKYYSLNPAGARALHNSYANLERISAGLMPKLMQRAGRNSRALGG